MHSYQKKYKLNPKLTNRYCESVYNPTVQPDSITPQNIPIPSTQNTIYSKEYQEENEL